MLAKHNQYAKETKTDTFVIDASCQVINACVSFESVDFDNITQLSSFAITIKQKQHEFDAIQTSLNNADTIDDELNAKRDEARSQLAESSSKLIQQFTTTNIVEILRQAQPIIDFDVGKIKNNNNNNADNDNDSFTFDDETRTKLEELKQWCAQVDNCRQNNAKQLHAMASKIISNIDPFCVDDDKQAQQSLRAELKSMLSKVDEIAKDPYSQLPPQPIQTMIDIVSKVKRVLIALKQLNDDVGEVVKAQQHWLAQWQTVSAIDIQQLENGAEQARKRSKKAYKALFQAQHSLKLVEMATDSEEDDDDSENNIDELKKAVQQAKQEYGKASKQLDDIVLQLNILGSVHFPVILILFLKKC